MSEATKILWSGLTGRTGIEALRYARGRDDVAIIGGLSLRGRAGHEDILDELSELSLWAGYCAEANDAWVANFTRLAKAFEFDVIVDFSHPEVFDQMLSLAVHTKKPFISGTSGINNRQVLMLYDAAKIIPVFRGGNFRFRVKEFIDECAEWVGSCGGNFTLFENFYKGKTLPSETSEVIKRKLEATGAKIDVHSSATYDKTSLVCDWKLLRKDDSNGGYLSEGLHCRTIGFGELAHDVLEIAKVMAKKPINEGGSLYTLDDLWPDLISS